MRLYITEYLGGISKMNRTDTSKEIISRRNNILGKKHYKRNYIISKT